jgi:replicative DNA helicase
MTNDSAEPEVKGSFTEELIFNQLAHNDEFFYRVFPFLKAEYFQGPEKAVFAAFQTHFDKYEKPATSEMIEIYLSKNKNVNTKLFEEALSFSKEYLREKKEIDLAFMLDSTEGFVQEKALYNALAKSVSIFDEGTAIDRNNIPDILNEALSISFQTDIGLDYIEDALVRFQRLKNKADKLPFLTPILNDITGGGFERKTINCILASTNVGKSAFLCHYAAEMLSQGYNVLYVSMEMAEEKLGTRIDANLMDMAMDDVLAMSETEFMNNINRLKTKGGKLIFKEFPTASVHMGHVEAMIRELKNKKGFVPDVVCLDYLGICLSRRVGLGAGTYLFVKAITEEFRGLAVKYNFVGLTATQGTRSTIEASDMNMSDTGDSKGINDTVDFMLAMMAPEEIAKNNLMLCKQLKSRYGDVNRKKRFVMTFNRSKMFFEEAEDPGAAAGFLGQAIDNSTAPGVIDEDKPLFDSSTGDRYLGEKTKGKLSGLSGIQF